MSRRTSLLRTSRRRRMSVTDTEQLQTLADVLKSLNLNIDLETEKRIAEFVFNCLSDSFIEGYLSALKDTFAEDTSGPPLTSQYGLWNPDHGFGSGQTSPLLHDTPQAVRIRYGMPVKKWEIWEFALIPVKKVDSDAAAKD
jgi:hypothetical protein